MENPLLSMPNVMNTAMSKWGKVMSGSVDTDLALYNSLSTDDMTAIMREYGVDDTLTYIKTMEGKRMGGKNGN